MYRHEQRAEEEAGGTPGGQEPETEGVHDQRVLRKGPQPRHLTG